jgi:alpha-beta hydrolase superfamily lysophospholipase
MEEQLTFQNSSGEILDGRLHLPTSQTSMAAIICHGFGGNKNLIWLHNICDELAENNFAALRFDFSGHGDSEGNFGDFTIKKGVSDLRAAIETMKEKGYETFALLGHSIGGSITILTAQVQDGSGECARISGICSV